MKWVTDFPRKQASCLTSRIPLLLQLQLKFNLSISEEKDVEEDIAIEELIEPNDDDDKSISF